MVATVIRGVMVDVAGVLVDGGKSLPGAAAAMARLRAAELPIRFLTNSTRKPKRRLLEVLGRAGIEAGADEVMTPAGAAMAWLAAKGLQPHLLIHPDLEEDFAGCPTTGQVAVVLGDAGPFFNFERLNAAFRQLDRGAPFFALAANRVFKDDDGELSMDAGAFVQALEYCSGVEATLLGKPAPAFFDAAASSMGVALADTAMIGDDAEADVAGALAAGVGSAILVQTGKYRAKDEDRFDPKPSATVPTIEDAVGRVLG